MEKSENDFKIPTNRSLLEALIITLYYVRLPCLKDVLIVYHEPLYPKNSSFLETIYLILDSLNNSLDINFQSFATVMDDERSFCINGFPGCVMEIDLQKKIYFNNVYYTLIGTFMEY